MEKGSKEKTGGRFRHVLKRILGKKLCKEIKNSEKVLGGSFCGFAEEKIQKKIWKKILENVVGKGSMTSSDGKVLRETFGNSSGKMIWEKVLEKSLGEKN